MVVSVARQAFSTFAVADGADVSGHAPFWRWEWTARAGWIAIEVGVTAATCVLWRPSSAPEQYAYRELKFAPPASPPVRADGIRRRVRATRRALRAENQIRG